MNAVRWARLLARAQRVVAATVAELPEEIRDEAQKIPCLFEPLNEDDPDLLGTYGHFTLHEISPANGPIVLYLQALDEYCQDEGGDFDEEVRITFLHELGHHFGWDEGELEERGLA
jgi:predicted Zn-dependent protease with MMP-like domain